MISARIIADSVNPNGKRLTTFELIYPRFIHAEVMTHRALSKNGASSRAIPIKKIMQAVRKNPASPVYWGTNQAGMQAKEELTGWRLRWAQRIFFFARWPVLFFVWMMTKLNLHKQISNRVLEPWMHMTLVCSATELDNFFKLRLHPDAQPEFQELAKQMKSAMTLSTPRNLEWGQWHLPYVDINDDYMDPLLPMVSAARCARVSYVRQNEKRDNQVDADMAIKLKNSGHWSPFEHPAQAVENCPDSNFCGGWAQLRKFYPEESGK